MQIRSSQLSHFRQQLIQLAKAGFPEITSFLSARPLTKGTVYTLRRKCSKPSCRCARGALHESIVLTASVSGKTRLWTIPKERIEELRAATRAYRHFRKARVHFLKRCLQRQREMLRIIDHIEKIRTHEP